jgi:hypothetical protein
MGGGVIARDPSQRKTGSLTCFQRLPDNPIITPDMGKLGGNINGPSLIRVPDWIENPLGTYYLYFAHHIGKYIRLAYADDLAGPWTIYDPGTLRLEQTACREHIASPDVHVDHANRQIRMYFHGRVVLPDRSSDWLVQNFPILGNQRSLVATSANGLDFTGLAEVLGASYFRVFEWDGYYYALSMPGIFYRSQDGLTEFERGPVLFSANMRHSAILRRDSTLYVFYSNVGDAPERILLSTIDLKPDWSAWTATDPITVLEPATVYEGTDLPIEASQRGGAMTRVRQLRDPAIFEENGTVYLLYTIAGEQGIAIARACD